jgi:hypothetical protein
VFGASADAADSLPCNWAVLRAIVREHLEAFINGSAFGEEYFNRFLPEFVGLLYDLAHMDSVAL